MNIRAKQSLGLLLVSLIPLALVATYILSEFRSYAVESAISNIRLIATIKQSRVRSELDQYLDHTKLVASNPLFRLFLEESEGGNQPEQLQQYIDKLFVNVREAVGTVQSIELVSDDGSLNFSTSSSSGRNLKAPSYHVSSFDRNGPQIVNISFDDSTRQKVVVSTPVRRNDQLVGFLVVSYYDDAITEIITDYAGLGATGETVLARPVEGKYLILAPLRFGYWGYERQSRKHPPRPHILAKLIGSVNSTHHVTRDYRGKIVHAVRLPLNDYGLELVVKMDEREIVGIIQNVKHKVLMLLFLVATVSLFFSISYSLKITKPLSTLTNTALRIADGKLNLRAPVDSNDEISELARAFNVMTEKLIEANINLEEKINIRTQELETYTKELEKSRIAALNILEDLRAQQKELEREVADRQESEERFRSMVESSPIGKIIFDGAGIITLANRRAESLLGYRHGELIGQSFDLLVPGQLETLSSATQEATQENSHVVRSDVLARHKDGLEMPVEIGLTPLMVKGELSVLCSIVDLTDRKETEDRLRNHKEELERSNRELEQFAYIASHDLKEPIRMVSSFAQLLENDYKALFDDTGSEYLNYLIDGAKRMQLLIDDLLKYSRVGRGRVELEEFPSEEAVSAALEFLTLKIEECGAKIRYKDLPLVLANRVQLTQVFQNIIQNSIKFRRSDVTLKINITGKRSGKEWLFSISDNGVGFDPRYAEKIFVIFQRLHHRKDFDGTGLGLAICQKVIALHGGRIWAQSEPGKGTTICFSLPVRAKNVTSGRYESPPVTQEAV